jgi:hypothetical protein
MSCRLPVIFNSGDHLEQYGMLDDTACHALLDDTACHSKFELCWQCFSLLFDVIYLMLVQL